MLVFLSKLFRRFDFIVISPLFCLFFLSFSLQSKTIEGTDFHFYDATTNEYFQNVEGLIFNRANFPEKYTVTHEPGLYDDPPAELVKSVVFYLNGKKIRTESFEPYALGGDNKGNFNPYELPLGSINITTKYYSERFAQGELIGGSGISFCLIDLNLNVLHVDQETIEIELPAGKKTKVDFYLSLDDLENFELQEPRFFLERDWYYLEEPLQLGKNTIVIDASNIAPSRFEYRLGLGMNAVYKGTAFPCLDDSYWTPSAGAFVEVKIKFISSDELLISSMTMIDIDQNRDRYQFAARGAKDQYFQFDNPNRPIPDNLSIRADVYNKAGSVVFEYAFTAPGEEEQPLEYLRTENVDPYALFGNSPDGGYYGIPKKAGFYRVKATPYTQSRGKGEAGIPFEITFKIAEPINLTTDSVVPEDFPSIDDLSIAPNPLVREATITYLPAQNGFVSLELYDLQGNLIRRLYEGQRQKEQEISLQLNREGLHQGIYILRKQTQEGTTIQRVKVD